MSWSLFKNLFARRKENEKKSTSPLADGADCFALWYEQATGIPLELSKVDAFVESRRHDFSDAMFADATCYLALTLQKAVGGEWSEHELFGTVLRVGPKAVLRPDMVLEKKLELGSDFSIRQWFEKVPFRMEAEASAPFHLKGGNELLLSDLKGISGAKAQAISSLQAELFREAWKERFKIALPLSLNGVREVDRFLRSNYLVFFLDEITLIRAGFFLGEVGRGLFQGEWDFTKVEAPEEAPLRYPELDYKPVGRIFKMMVECPESEPLDEYLRLIPSARKELAKLSREKEATRHPQSKSP